MEHIMVRQLALAVGLGMMMLAGANEPPGLIGLKAPHERLLTGDNAKTAAMLQKRTKTAEEADQYKEAITLQEELQALRSKYQGADHWETIDTKWYLDAIRKVAALSPKQRADWRKVCLGIDEAKHLEARAQYAKAQSLWEDYSRSSVKVLGEKHPRTIASYNGLASILNSQGKFADAQPLYQKTLNLNRELLGEMHPDTATGFNNLAYNLYSQGKYADAQSSYQKALELYHRLLGNKHTLIAISYNNLGVNLTAQRKYTEAYKFYKLALDLQLELFGEKHTDIAASYNNLATNLCYQRKNAEAQVFFQKALDLNRALHGEKHYDTANSYHNLAFNLQEEQKHEEAHTYYMIALNIYRELIGDKHHRTVLCYTNLADNLSIQGKHAEAQPFLQKLLEIRRELFGDKHPDTASSYFYLALNLGLQGRYIDARQLFQKALDLRRELFGEEHPNTAGSYVGLANTLEEEGKYTDAQILHQTSLDLHRKLFGDKHPDTANCYHRLANNLDHQRRYTEAQILHQKALDLTRELFGDKHPSTAGCYSGLATNMTYQKKYTDAQLLYESALNINRALKGEKDLQVAISYNNLAANLHAQGKHADAQPLLQKALDIYRERFNDKHPHTATFYNNLASNLGAQGKHADAQLLYQKAVDLQRELLGDKHPDSTRNYRNLAVNLYVQGKYVEAQRLLVKASISYEAARLGVADRGLDRAVFGADQSPYTRLAMIQAQLRVPAAAWVAAENDLARGLSDETAFYRQGRLPPDEKKRHDTLIHQLDLIQPRILQLHSKSAPTDPEKDELAKLRDKRQELESELSDLDVDLSQREVANLPVVQAAIPANAALVLWVDGLNDVGQFQNHWGCVVRRTGEPAWERLPGTGPDQTWSGDDSALPMKLREALVSGTMSNADLDLLAKRLYAQRLSPLSRHLGGVKTLYVVPVHAMAGIPVEVMTREYTISYVPSGTFLARLKDRASFTGSALLALGDPVFSRPGAKPESTLALPPGGLLIQQVVPDGTAAKARIQAGDVLVRYGETELSAAEALSGAIQAQAAAKEVSITVWRDGVDKPFTRMVPPGRLGVVVSKEPAREAIANRRKTDAMLLTVRGRDWKELPGTRSEVAQIAKLFGPTATTLFDSAASEQSLDGLRRKKELSKFRYLHFATHGEANTERTLESILVLAQDTLPQTVLPKVGEPLINGQLSAREVLEFWELDAELVTLSACETAIGPQGGGEGLLGFAQPFLIRGSRAVCLSLWKVDDAATALLMIRFYQNLLGKRDGLTAPMPKALALGEAKRWLRELSSEEALKLTAAATDGVVRGKGQPALKLLAPAAPAGSLPDGFKPFAHPRYWAAFILIGDPN